MKVDFRKPVALYMSLLLMLMLTGCGSSERSFINGGFIFGMLTSFIISLVTALSTINRAIGSKRGTNVVTRFVRDTGTNALMNRSYTQLIILLVVCGMICFASSGIFGFILAIIPPIGAMVLILMWRQKSTQDVQRIKDARVVTKGALDVGAQTGAVAGYATGVALEACGVPGGVQMGKLAGSAVSSISASASANMQVDGAAHIDMSETVAVAEKMIDDKRMDLAGYNETLKKIQDPNRFLDQAERLGIDVKGKSLEQVADDIVEVAPKSLLEQRTRDMSNIDFAMKILDSYREEPRERIG